MRNLLTTVIILCIFVLFMAVSASITFAAEPECPTDITESGATSFWASYSDYRERLLTVDETLSSNSPCLSCRLQLEEVHVSNGVSLETPLPSYLGELQQAGSRQLRMKFRIPHGVGSFNSRIRLICVPAPAPDPVPPQVMPVMTLDPPMALANEGCPEISLGVAGSHPIPGDTAYGPRRFLVTLKDAGGNPLSGRSIKWSLSNDIDFRVTDSTATTDANGQAYAVITPPQYFICIIPYYSRGRTLVVASGEEGDSAASIFVYTRCAPPGSVPPWMASPGAL